jgi:hypothetical protein
MSSEEIKRYIDYLDDEFAIINNLLEQKAEEVSKMDTTGLDINVIQGEK